MNERGQVTVLVVGMTMVVFAVAGLAVDGTRAFIYRRTLQSAADAAALAGAAELDKRAYYLSRGQEVTIDPAGARSIAHDSIRTRGLPVVVAVHATTDEVGIVLRGTVETFFLRLVGLRRMPVAVEAMSVPVAAP